MDLLCEGCLPSSWDGFFLACCQAAPEWDQGWTWVSTWKSSRIRRHWSFKASWQIWFAEIKERFEIFDVSHFLQVCLDIRAPKTCTTHWFHLQMLILSSQKNCTKPAASCPLWPQKTRRLSKFCRKGWKRVGAAWGVSPRQFHRRRFDLSKVDHVSVSICSRRSFRSEWLGKCARPVALEHWFEVEEVSRPKLTMIVSFSLGFEGKYSLKL